ncbi:hypothetical protein [Flexibacterium corallicola]|uniref:hypothetical protein n=1 Tax=Flexibacterium corallicola TaxID=3037259 RepID=UPI00286F63A0|nr:hypothetical protein [Pseudovibrio sp. M1P-2-3]
MNDGTPVARGIVMSPFMDLSGKVIEPGEKGLEVHFYTPVKEGNSKRHTAATLRNGKNKIPEGFGVVELERPKFTTDPDTGKCTINADYINVISRDKTDHIKVHPEETQYLYSVSQEGAVRDTNGEILIDQESGKPRVWQQRQHLSLRTSKPVQSIEDLQDSVLTALTLPEGYGVESETAVGSPYAYIQMCLVERDDQNNVVKVEDTYRTVFNASEKYKNEKGEERTRFLSPEKSFEEWMARDIKDASENGRRPWVDALKTFGGNTDFHCIVTRGQSFNTGRDSVSLSEENIDLREVISGRDCSNTANMIRVKEDGKPIYNERAYKQGFTKCYISGLDPLKTQNNGKSYFGTRLVALPYISKIDGKIELSNAKFKCGRLPLLGLPADVKKFILEEAKENYKKDKDLKFDLWHRKNPKPPKNENRENAQPVNDGGGSRSYFKR